VSVRIAITGTGLVTPAGEDPAALARRVADGTPADFPPVSVPGFPDDPACALGVVRGADPEPFLRDRKNLKYMDTLARLLVRAAGLAVTGARLEPASLDPFSVGVYMGIGHVACEPADLRPILTAGRAPGGVFDAALLGNRCRINPISVFRSLPNIPACQISIALGFRGENSVLYPGAAQSAMAMAEALDALREGRCDVALAGGAFQASSFLTLHTLRMVGCLPGTGLPPGVAPADGAAVLVLERLDSARARGGPILGELFAVEGAGGPGHPYAGPDSPEPLARAIQAVLDGRGATGGVAILGDDGQGARPALARETFASALGSDLRSWSCVDSRPATGNLSAANWPVDLIVALALARTTASRLALVGALGPGSDVAACLLGSVPS
jgi:3-oxoacyl-[acyl-carrier-protein] synthase II